MSIMSRIAAARAAPAVYALLVALAAQPALAAPPITMIIPTPPGGGVDIYFRALAKAIGTEQGVNVVPQNVPGGGGAIGVEKLVQSRPDGNTIAAVWTGPISITPHTLGVQYKPTDYIPVVEFSSAPYVICARPDFPASNGKELIELAKKNPDRYAYGTDGPGGLGQLAATRIFAAFGTSARPIPYKGAGETSLALLGSNVDLYMGTIPSILPFVKSGKAKCLLVTAANRQSVLPDTTSLGELGIPQAELSLWRAVLVPKGTPQADIERLEKMFERAAHSKESQAFLEQNGEKLEIVKGQALRAKLDAEYAAIGQAAQAAGLAKSN
jgi:tripartite-type tricarboxylate transporter receptor subunit TctC